MSIENFCNLRCASGAFNNLMKLRIDLLELERVQNRSELDEAYIVKKKAEILIVGITLKMYLKDINDLSIFSITDL